jgi:hypothetical protein
MGKPYDFDSVSYALERAREREDIQSWSSGQTGHARARVYFNVETSERDYRFSLDEARAFLVGVMVGRDRGRAALWAELEREAKL